jgi:hypothetical protein
MLISFKSHKLHDHEKKNYTYYKDYNTDEAIDNVLIWYDY